MRAFFLILTLATTAAAQPIKTITLTNRAGRVFENVRILQTNVDGLIWAFTNRAGGGKIAYSELEELVARQFGFDPAQAETAKLAAERRRQADLRQRRDFQNAMADQQRLLDLQKYRVGICGEVLQKVSDGLLVLSGSESRKSSAALDSELQSVLRPGARILPGGKSSFTIGYAPGYMELCLLTDYTNYFRVVDRDVVTAVAYPNGEYSYSAVSGGRKTVRIFTCDPAKVERLPTREEWARIIAAKE